MIFKNRCILALWMKVASALEGLNDFQESFCILALWMKVASALEGLNDFQKSLHPCALDEGCLSIGRVK